MPELNAVDLEKKRVLRLQKLSEDLATGENSQIVKAVMAPLLDGMKTDIFNALCNSQQTIDPAVLSELHCELRVMTRIQKRLDSAIETGKQAEEAIKQANKNVELTAEIASRSYQF